MTALIDTHTLLWAGLSMDRLSRAAASILSDPRTVVLVSAASAWEIATKVRLGKLPEANVFERQLEEKLMKAGYAVLPVEFRDAMRAGRLPGHHRDPFDRMIAAQALNRKIPVISRDEKLDEFGVERLW